MTNSDAQLTMIWVEHGFTVAICDKHVLTIMPLRMHNSIPFATPYGMETPHSLSPPTYRTSVSDVPLVYALLSVEVHKIQMLVSHCLTILHIILSMITTLDMWQCNWAMQTETIHTTFLFPVLQLILHLCMLLFTFSQVLQYAADVDKCPIHHDNRTTSIIITSIKYCRLVFRDSWMWRWLQPRQVT